jgi:drug/metabolite transporter (DMT)-like permease
MRLPASSARLRVLLALAAVYLIWGSTYYAMRLALESLPPLLMAGIRFLVAGAGLYLVLRLRGVRAPGRAEWKTAALLGLFLLIGGNGLVAYSQQWVSSSLAAIVVATMPLWAALFVSPACWC